MSKSRLIAIAAAAAAVLIVVFVVLLRQTNAANSTATATSTVSLVPQTLGAATATPSSPRTSYSPDGAHSGESPISPADKTAVTALCDKYVTVWFTVPDAAARATQFAPLATPQHAARAAAVDPRNITGSVAGPAVVMSGNAYQATVRVPLAEGKSLYLRVIADPTGEFGWRVGEIIAAAEAEATR